MPLYEFMDNSGRILEQQFPLSRCPDLGAVVLVDDPDRPGKKIKATRILSPPAAVRGDNWKPYASRRLPRHLKGVKCTPAGLPIIETRRQEKDIASKLHMERE